MGRQAKSLLVEPRPEDEPFIRPILRSIWTAAAALLGFRPAELDRVEARQRYLNFLPSLPPLREPDAGRETSETGREH